MSDVEDTISYDLRGDELLEVGYYVLQFILYVDEVMHERIEELHVVEKMDSGASANMSGSKDR